METRKPGKSLPTETNPAFCLPRKKKGGRSVHIPATLLTLAKLQVATISAKRAPSAKTLIPQDEQLRNVTGCRGDKGNGVSA